MNATIKPAFLALIIAQAAHSVEECFMHLWEVLAPARMIAGLFTTNLAVGFAGGNVALVLFGVWCYAVPVRRDWPTAPGFVWFWTLLELGNGTGHLLFALNAGGYFPGLITAPFLLALSIYTISQLVRPPAPAR